MAAPWKPFTRAVSLTAMPAPREVKVMPGAASRPADLMIARSIRMAWRFG
jgi:hypothetical protein